MQLGIQSTLFTSLISSPAGDTLEPGVFNPARLLIFDPDKEGNDTAATARVLEKIKLLESDEAARELWFSQPSVLPSANEWLTDWCRNASDLFRAALLRKGHRVWPTLKADGVPNP